MRDLYYEIEITNEVPCAVDDCDEVSSFQFCKTDIDLSELKGIDLDDIEEMAKRTHTNWDWKKIDGEWYCPLHDATDKEEEEPA